MYKTVCWKGFKCNHETDVGINLLPPLPVCPWSPFCKPSVTTLLPGHLNPA